MACPVHMCVLGLFSCIRLCATAWTVAHQAPLSMGFSRQEYWSGLPCLLQGIFPTQGSNLHLLCLLHWQEGSLELVPPRKPLSEMMNVQMSLELCDSIRSSFCSEAGLLPS